MDFDTDKVNLIQCKSIFVDRAYMCLEFEMLDINLWDFMNTRPTKCLLVKEIRPILHQVHLPPSQLNVYCRSLWKFGVFSGNFGVRGFVPCRGLS